MQSKTNNLGECQQQRATIQIDGIPVCVTYKRMKNVIMRIDTKDKVVRVSAPFGCHHDLIVEIVRKHKEKIKSRFNKRAVFDISEPDLSEGGLIPFLGQLFRLHIEHIEYTTARNVSINHKDRTITLFVCSDDSKRELFHTLIQWYFKNFRNILIPIIDKYAAKVGRKANTYGIKIVNSYWGICRNRAKSIIFNLKLIAMPSEVIELIVLHEHVHLKYFNHGKDFKAEMTRLMPDWKHREDELKSYQRYFI